MYRVLTPVYEAVESNRRRPSGLLREKYLSTPPPEPDWVVVWKQVGTADSIEHAKAQGFIAPVLEASHFATKPYDMRHYK